MEKSEQKMSETTLFLLTLIGVLFSANLFLWWEEKRNTQKSLAQTIQDRPTEAIEQFQEASQKAFSETIERGMEKQKETKKLKIGKKSKRVKALEAYLKKIGA